jgi:hypothetical protein
MKNLTMYIIINVLFTISIYGDINLYYVENVVEIQNGKRFDYNIDYKLKSYNFDSEKFSDIDACNSCKKPLKLIKAPLDKWVVVIEYKIDDEESIKNKKELLSKLKEHFDVVPQKKDSNNDVILSYYEIKKIDKPIKEPIVSGVKILQNDKYSQKVIIPPNDNFVLLSSKAVDEGGKYFNSNDIKLTSSCGKLKIKDSSRFSFTFFEGEQNCLIYAKIGIYMDFVEVIRLNKDGSMPSSFNILYENNNVDKINIDYLTFKRKGVVLKSNKNDNSFKWSINNDNLRMQVLKDGVIVYPKKESKKYKVELLDIKKGLSDSIIILLKDK